MTKKKATAESSQKTAKPVKNHKMDETPKSNRASNGGDALQPPDHSLFGVLFVVSLLSCILVSTVLFAYISDPTSEASTDGMTNDVLKLLQKSSDHLRSLVGHTAEDQPSAAQSATETPSGRQQTGIYVKANITNAADNKIRAELDTADDILTKGDAMKALDLYNKVLNRYPKSPRAVYGKANALNELAAQRRSNKELEQAIEVYASLLEMSDVPKALMMESGRTCAQRQGFRGWGLRAIKTQRRLLELFPEEWMLWNEVGINYLIMGKNEEGRAAFKKVLEVQPSNGLAKVHLGFIIKTVDKDYAAAIPYLWEGIQSGEKGVIDGRFYFQLGDALYRTGRANESYQIYSEGASRGVFRSTLQRSLYNVDGLDARPWWTLEETGIAKSLKMLETHWEEIRDEGLANLDVKLGVFKKEDEDLSEKGDWRQLTLYQQGRKNEENCRRAPRTCALVSQIQEATSCSRGQIKFSVMQPGVHVWPHCGPTNCRVRCHLGLVVPSGPRIRVGEETRHWVEGRFIVFDDSFEHEVWHDGASVRLVLIVDIWHPQLSQHHRRTLPAI